VKVAGDGDGIEQVMKGAPFFSPFGSYVLIFSTDVRVEGPERRALRYTIGKGRRFNLQLGEPAGEFHTSWIGE